METRPRGPGFEPHQHDCIVVLEQVLIEQVLIVVFVQLYPDFYLFFENTVDPDQMASDEAI